jgi:hypothetical protein
VFGSLAQRRGFREYLPGLLARRARNKTLIALAGAGPVTGAQHPAAMAVSAPMASPISVRANKSTAAFGSRPTGLPRWRRWRRQRSARFAAEPVRGRATQDRADRRAERGAGDQVALGKALSGYTG